MVNGVKSSPNPNLLRCLTVQFKRVLPECFLRSLSGLSVLGCQDDNYAGLSPSLKGNDALKIFWHQGDLIHKVIGCDHGFEC